MSFKIGDRVVVTGDNIGNVSIGAIGYIEEINKTLTTPYWVKSDYNCQGLWSKVKFIGGTMSKYDELWGRIENNRNNGLGWGKEFDDILGEINYEDASYYIVIGWNCIYIENYEEMGGVARKSLESFHFRNQCDKNKALHDVALWLLDHSDIKKDEKKDKIKELEIQIKDIQRQIKELK